jgi:hypothetical protein
VASWEGQVVADHARDWGHARTITDPRHQATARLLRQNLAAYRKQTTTRLHADGHVVPIRALPDYDALFGVDFDPRPDLGTVQETPAERKL